MIELLILYTNEKHHLYDENSDKYDRSLQKLMPTLLSSEVFQGNNPMQIKEKKVKNNTDITSCIESEHRLSGTHKIKKMDNNCKGWIIFGIIGFLFCVLVFEKNQIFYSDFYFYLNRSRIEAPFDSESFRANKE